MKLFAISGAQCTGKTTLINYIDSYGKNIIEQNKNKEVEVYKELIRDIMIPIGVPINENTNNDTQLIISNMQYYEMFRLTNKYKNNDNMVVVYDRCNIDSLVYTTWAREQGNLSDWVYDYTIKLTKESFKFYNKIFYITPEIKLVEDGIRSTNKNFYDEVINIFDYWLNEFKDYTNIIHINGSIEERFNIIYNEI